MIDLIQSEFRKIVLNCINKYAKNKALSVDNVQLMLGFNGIDNTYHILENYAKKEEFSIMDVLGVKIDFLGYSKLAPPFIAKSITRFAKVLKSEVNKVEVMCVVDKNEKGKEIINLYLYKSGQYEETIEFEDLFNEEDFEMPQ
jgi:hypothetical protein